MRLTTVVQCTGKFVTLPSTSVEEDDISRVSLLITLDSSVTNEVVVGFEVVISGVLGVVLDATLSFSVTTSFLFWVVEEAISEEAIVGSSVSGVDETVCFVACEVVEEIATVLDTTLSVDVERTSLFTVEEAVSVEEMACSCVSVVDETVCSVPCEVEEEIVLGFSEVTLSIFSEDEDVSTGSISFTLSAISGISEVVIFLVEVVAVASVVTSSEM